MESICLADMIWCWPASFDRAHRDGAFPFRQRFGEESCCRPRWRCEGPLELGSSQDRPNFSGATLRA